MGFFWFSVIEQREKNPVGNAVFSSRLLAIITSVSGPRCGSSGRAGHGPGPWKGLDCAGQSNVLSQSTTRILHLDTETLCVCERVGVGYVFVHNWERQTDRQTDRQSLCVRACVRACACVCWWGYRSMQTHVVFISVLYSARILFNVYWMFEKASENSANISVRWKTITSV